jgi:hypothetical protein
LLVLQNPLRLDRLSQHLACGREFRHQLECRLRLYPRKVRQTMTQTPLGKAMALMRITEIGSAPQAQVGLFWRCAQSGDLSLRIDLSAAIQPTHAAVGLPFELTDNR